MDRKEELMSIVESIDNNTKIILLPLIDEILFIEEQLVELKKLPFIKVHPKNSDMQKATPAAKQYKELLQQYTNAITVLGRATGADESDEESPLRKWIRSRKDVN